MGGMTLIDTKVISELMRLSPTPAVLEWFGRESATDLYFSAVGEAELRRGAAILPTGDRRESLVAEIDAMVTEDFAGRVLPFDSAAAVAFAKVFADRQGAGRPISFPDCQIAAIARSRSMAVATRNVRDFKDTGVQIVNPWTAD